MTDHRRQDLTRAVQQAGCNRARWDDLAALAEVMDLEAFLDTEGSIDHAKVEAWVATVLPERFGPSWEAVEALTAASGRQVDICYFEIDETGVTSTTTRDLLVAARSTLILGYPTDPEPLDAA